MFILLWLLQSLLAAELLVTGYLKVFIPIEALSERWAWLDLVIHFPGVLVRVIGLIELLGAVGLIVPALLGILPWLTPWAAFWICVLMVSAIIFNISRQKYEELFINVVNHAIAALIAYGRWVVLPA